MKWPIIWPISVRLAFTPYPARLRRPGPGYRRPPAGDDVGEHVGGTAGMGPAERAVSRVQIEVLELALADIGHVGGRGRPQPGPELRLGRIGDVGKDLERAPHQRSAARRVEAEIV